MALTTGVGKAYAVARGKAGEGLPINQAGELAILADRAAVGA